MYEPFKNDRDLPLWFRWYMTFAFTFAALVVGAFFVALIVDSI